MGASGEGSQPGPGSGLASGCTCGMAGRERLQAQSRKGPDGHSATICWVLPHFRLNHSKFQKVIIANSSCLTSSDSNTCLYSLSYYYCLVL